MDGLSVGRAGHSNRGQGGCFGRRFGEGRRLNPAGVIRALSRNGNSSTQNRKPAETLPNPPIPPATLLLLHYSCTTATPAAHAALVTPEVPVTPETLVTPEVPVTPEAPVTLWLL